MQGIIPFVLYDRFILLFFLLSGSVFGQTQQLGTELTLRGDRLSGVVLPVLPRAADISIQGLRANAWSVDDTKRLLVEQNVLITIGAYAFEAEQAVVWINRMDTDAGIVSQIAVFLPTFAKSSNHAAIGAEGENLLVIGSTLGTVTLDVALLEPQKPSTHPNLLQRAKKRLAGYLYDLAISPPQLSTQPRIVTPPDEEQDALAKATLIVEEERGWLRPKSGFVSVAADLVEFLPDEIENAITIAGNVQLSVRSTAGVDDMDMSATRGVIFLDPGSVRDIASGRVDISDIRGV
jgi:hypothetical protein